VDETFLPSDSKEQAAAIDFIARLRAKMVHTKDAHARLVDSEGHEVVLPDSMFAVLAQVAEAMQAGLAVTVAPHHLTLSTQESADLLHVSRTTLVRLLERRIIPFDKPGRHRKVRLSDLLEYRRRQRRLADQALSDMVADTERLGLYDENAQNVRQALTAARRSGSAQ
jgi:excisionase family DNA binding protein